MKYKLVLVFYLSPDNHRILEFLQGTMELFRQMFPDAKNVDEPFATVSWEENPVNTDAIGKIDKGLADDIQV